MAMRALLEVATHLVETRGLLEASTGHWEEGRLDEVQEAFDVIQRLARHVGELERIVGRWLVEHGDDEWLEHKRTRARIVARNDALDGPRLSNAGSRFRPDPGEP